MASANYYPGPVNEPPEREPRADRRVSVTLPDGPIIVNGEDITSAVSEIDISARSWNRLPVITLGLAVHAVDVTAMCDSEPRILVNLTPEVRRALIVAGWTAPKED